MNGKRKLGPVVGDGRRIDNGEGKQRLLAVGIAEPELLKQTFIIDAGRFHSDNDALRSPFLEDVIEPRSEDVKPGL